MNQLQTALYARVSSDRQAKAHTIHSQVAAILERAKVDGVDIPALFHFIDDGYSGSTMIRPALELLRDQIAAQRTRQPGGCRDAT